MCRKDDIFLRKVSTPNNQNAVQCNAAIIYNASDDSIEPEEEEEIMDTIIRGYNRLRESFDSHESMDQFLDDSMKDTWSFVENLLP